RSDARIVSATNRNIQELVEEGTFREDLYYRLNIIPIYVPPLRSRREDIPLLIKHFLDHFCLRHRRSPKVLDAAAMKLLSENAWPGNIRQLRNVIERLVITSQGEEIQCKDLPAELTRLAKEESVLKGSLVEIAEAAEKVAIAQALSSNEFHRERTAKALGISVRTLHYKMNRYNLH
ncbi:MAG: helix-turn-helix domain-containing protein, partial [Pirellula sp.]